MFIKINRFSFHIIILMMLVFCSSCQVQEGQSSTPVSIAEANTSTPILPIPSPSLTPGVIGRQLFSLTVPAQHSLYPAISPDGHWLAIPGYSSTKNSESVWTETFNVWVHDLTNPSDSQWIPLFSNSKEFNQLSKVLFSPDGKYLAVVSGNGIWFFETSNWKTYIKYNHPTLTQIFTWSPDSKGIAVQIQENGYILYYLKIDGSLRPLLTEEDVFPVGISDEEILNVFIWGPTWSPDGKKLAYIKYTQDNRELWILDITTGKKEIILNNDDGDEPVWSPDGEKIATYKGYINVYDFQTKILSSYFADLYDSHSNPIEPDFVWSPDGKQLAVQINLTGWEKDEYLYLVNVDTGNKQLLALGRNDPYGWTENNDILSYDMAGQTLRLWHYSDN